MMWLKQMVVASLYHSFRFLEYFFQLAYIFLCSYETQILPLIKTQDVLGPVTMQSVSKSMTFLLAFEFYII